MKKRLKRRVLDSAEIIDFAHQRMEDDASRLLGMIDEMSGSDVAAVVSLVALNLAGLTVGRVRDGKLRVRSTDDFERQFGGRFELEVHWSEVEIAFDHFYFPEHWDAGGTLA